MKRIRFPIIHTAILAMVIWSAVQFLAGCADSRPRSYGDMKQQAEKAIKDVGGAVPLEAEAKLILSNYRVGSDWMSNNATSFPAITKLQSLLSPHEGPWVVAAQKGFPSHGIESIPAHVVIRFGSHRDYKYVWIVDPANVPLGKMEGVEHLSGAVYLSEWN